jgi:hypothetical protein
MRRRLGLDIPETLEDACDPATMAVIVYDMQAGVLGQLPDGGAEAVDRVSQVLAAGTRCSPTSRPSRPCWPAEQLAKSRAGPAAWARWTRRPRAASGRCRGRWRPRSRPRCRTRAGSSARTRP